MTTKTSPTPAVASPPLVLVSALPAIITDVDGLAAGEGKLYLVSDGPDIVAVGKSNREARYTTQEMLELEARLLESAQELVTRGARLDRGLLDSVLTKRPTMTDEQRRAFFHVTHGQALSLVRGLAGTGKTFLLDAAREGAPKHPETARLESLAGGIEQKGLARAG